MKTPDEIKKGLECSITSKCIGEKCPYYKPDMPDMSFNPLDIDLEEYEKNYSCIDKNRADAFLLIQQLEQRDRELFERLPSAWFGKQCYMYITGGLNNGYTNES